MKTRTASLVSLVVLVLIALVVPSAVATDGGRVQATVSFGQWQTGAGPNPVPPPAFVNELDRFPAAQANQRLRNNHQLLPQEVHIKAGGAVNFIISGFHEPTIYDDGTQPDDINTNLVVPGPPVALINDPANRIEPPRVYRRLHSLRGWGHGETEPVFSGGAGASGTDGV